jgi:hypothetical protein
MATLTGAELARWEIAYHEAGHAVAHRVAGGKVRAVELHRNGHGVTITDEDGPTPATAQGWLVMLLAGGEAQAKFLTQHHFGLGKARRYVQSSCAGDLADFRRDSRGFGISESTARRGAERLVRSHWRRIDRAASLLLKNGRISGSQV